MVRIEKMFDMIITVRHVCMDNPKLNQMCLKLFVQYQLTICNFLLGGRRGGDILNADHVTDIVT